MNNIIARVLPVYLEKLILQNEHLATEFLILVLRYQFCHFVIGDREEADLFYATVREH